MLLTDYRSLMIDHRSQITDHRSQITDHRSQITDHRSQMTHRTSQITDHDHKSQMTHRRSQITDADCRLQITDHIHQITNTYLATQFGKFTFPLIVTVSLLVLGRIDRTDRFLSKARTVCNFRTVQKYFFHEKSLPLLHWDPCHRVQLSLLSLAASSSNWKGCKETSDQLKVDWVLLSATTEWISFDFIGLAKYFWRLVIVKQLIINSLYAWGCLPLW